jgi:hypothetical protein
MDEFLKPDALYDQLLHKYKKYGRLVIACDFDRTLYDSKESGESYEMVRQLIRDLYQHNCYIIIFTGNKNIAFMRNFLFKNNIPYNSINEDAPFVKIDNIGRKPYFNAIIDDRAGLICVYEALTKFLKTINYGKLD